MANVDTHEEFWGITLSKENKIYTWDPTAESEEDVEHKVQVTQACLGHKAKDGERNVVEVTTEDDDGKEVTCAVVSLRVGFVECMHLELGFTNASKFVLKEGNGPISLCGVHLQALPLDLNDDYDDDEDSEDDDEEVPQLVAPVSAKAKIEEVKPVEELETEEKPVEEAKAEKNEAVPVEGKVELKKVKKIDEKVAKKRVASDEKEIVPPKKMKPQEKEAKKDLTNDDEDELDDDDDDDDDDDEDDDVDDDDDIDMDDDDDDDMDSDEEDSDEEEEDESEDEKPTPKKKPEPKVNGHVKPTNQNKEKGKPKKPPAAADKENKNINNNKKETATPKGKKDAPVMTPHKKDAPVTTPHKKTPEELRIFLLKSPNLPKKYEKFANFMKNNMKVTDAKTQKDLWEYVQNNKK